MSSGQPSREAEAGVSDPAEPAANPSVAVSAASAPRPSWEDFRGALFALTILGRPAQVWKLPIGSSALFYPAVGALIGGLVGALDWVLRTFLSQEITSVFLLGMLALLSSGRQLDGFANAADGLIGFRGREWAIATMHDRPLGTSGAAAIFFLLILKVRSLDLISEPIRFAGLLLPPLIGRWALVALAYGARRAAADGEAAASFDSTIGARELAVASGFAVTVTLVAGGALGLFVLIIAGLATVGLRLYFDRRLGGVTGQALDAGAEVLEALALIIFALAS